VPTALPTPPVADAYSSDAIVTWSPQSDCVIFNAYVATGGLQVPVNNGEGLLLTTPTITVEDVHTPFSSFFLDFFFSLNPTSHLAGAIEELHCYRLLREWGRI